jgi:large subunit ribosomal protein L10
MALTRAEKEVQLQELKKKFQEASSIIFAHYIGMNVSDVSALRKELRTSGAEMKVAKKTLMQLAAKELSLPELEDSMLQGPVACIFSYSDPIAGPQAAMKFSKTHPQVAFIGGMFEGKILSMQDAKAMASLPNRATLLATFAGMLRSPLNKFAGMCNSPLTGFARAVSEVAKKGVPLAPAA